MDHSSPENAFGPPRPPTEEFNNGVADLLMATEELRQSLVIKQGAAVTVGRVLQWRGALEHCLQILDHVAALSDDAVADLETDVFIHCQQKTCQTALLTLQTSLTVQEPVEPVHGDDSTSHNNNNDDDNDDNIPVDVQRLDCQGAMARLVELNLVLLENGKLRGLDCEAKETATGVSMVEDAVIAPYVAYQRQVLRSRAKPAIAALVQERQREGRFANPILQHHHQQGSNDHDHDNQHATDAPHAGQQQQHYHAPVLTTILGQAAALIHPLSEWLVQLPPDVTDGIVGAIRKLCIDSIHTVDEQAQALTKTVSDWFWLDRPVDEWIQKMSNASSSAERTPGHENGNTSNDNSPDALCALDSLVNEMAFGCQVQARYHALVQNSGCNTALLPTTISHELLPEWTWKYASLERFLATQQWLAAVALAAPVTIVLGTGIQVPSVVEDAQYLSIRAVERAASTRSVQAIGTVGHAVSHDVWSTEERTGVHHALLEQRGCWCAAVVEEETDDSMSALKSSKDNGFASALLDALDDDIGGGVAPSLSANAHIPSKPPSAPASGNFLGFSMTAGGDKGEQMQLDSQFCALNGVHAAAGACLSLVSVLDSLLAADDDDENGDSPPQLDFVETDSKPMAMIQLANEELGRYGRAYQKLLTEQIDAMLEHWCGLGGDPAARGKQVLCFDKLRLFFNHEDYRLDAAHFNVAESDDRLDRDFIGPMEESRLLEQLADKCESDVLRQFGGLLITQLVSLVLTCLWENKKEFTDWGSLLLSKQIRKLQGFVSRAVSPQSSEGGPSAMMTNFVQLWERLSQTLTVLQLERPSDWLAYQATSILSPEELSKTMSLRVDFSADAIHAVVASVTKAATATTGASS